MIAVLDVLWRAWLLACAGLLGMSYWRIHRRRPHMQWAGASLVCLLVGYALLLVRVLAERAS